MRTRGGGLFDLLGAQIDSVVVNELPTDVRFDVLIRLVGTVQDFETEHNVEVVLSGPDLEQLGHLELPVGPRMPGPAHLPGYEINHTVGARIEFAATQIGGYDLSFAVDGTAQHRCKATMSVTRP